MLMAISRLNVGSGEASLQAEDREFQRQERRLRVEERRFRLFRQKIYLALTVLLVITAIVFTAIGLYPAAPLIAGGSSLATVTATLCEGHRAMRGRDA